MNIVYISTLIGHYFTHIYSHILIDFFKVIGVQSYDLIIKYYITSTKPLLTIQSLLNVENNNIYFEIIKEKLLNDCYTLLLSLLYASLIELFSPLTRIFS